MKENKIIFTAKKIAIISLTSAILIVSKFALSFIPNVEVVTTLIICFAFVFKYDSIFSTIVFCTADILIYPPSIDVIISYYIYWNLLSLIVATLSSLNIKNEWIYFTLSLIMTLLFGVITSFFFSLFYGVNFLAVYIAGVYFYLIHLISTTVFMLVAFNILTKTLENIKKKIYR